MIKRSTDFTIDLIDETDGNAVINSDTFVPTGERLGYGCWGEINVYKDLAGQEWAIKNFNPNKIAERQMQERGWTAEDVMRNEVIPLSAAYRHLVPRIIERDKDGRMYVGMPLHKDGDFSKKINSINLRDSLKIARDVADALSYIHEGKEASKKRKAHGDVKPSNILIKDGRAFLSDFGSSTCISIGGNGKVRGPHGDINYRAPECFGEKASPSTRADIWSLGAILYESVAKEGIYDGFNGSYTSDKENLRRFVRKKINKNVPWKLRGFLKKCLAVDEFDRFITGTPALSKLEKIIETFGTRKTIKDYARKFALPLGVPIVLTGLFIYKAFTHEPKELTIPQAQLQGQIYLDRTPSEELIKFDLENAKNLPGTFYLGYVADVDEISIKHSTRNRYAAALLKSYMQTVKHLGTLRAEIYTDAQQRMWSAYTSYEEKSMPTNNFLFSIPAKSIEVGLSKSKNLDKTIDLEDVLAIARLGEDKVNQARKASGSFEFNDYLTAKDSNGKYIIPEKEQKFLQYWRAYTLKLFK